MHAVISHNYAVVAARMSLKTLRVAKLLSQCADILLVSDSTGSRGVWD